MSRVNVTFSKETYQKLKDRANKNSSPSISNQVRELTELMLKIEGPAKKNDGIGDNFSKEQIIFLLNKILPWLLEARLLVRYLVETLPAPDSHDHQQILISYREKSENYIKGMLDAGTL